MNTSQFDSLAEELVGLLEWDPHILKAYILLLSSNGETIREELASGVGASKHGLGDHGFS